MEVSLFAEKGLLLLIAVLLFLGAMHDIYNRSVPNFISVGIFTVACLVMILNNRISEGSLSFVIISTLAIFLFRLNIWGGADAKVMMALSPLVSPTILPIYLIWLSLFLFPVAVFYALFNLYRYIQGFQNKMFLISVPFFVPVALCYVFVLYVCEFEIHSESLPSNTTMLLCLASCWSN